MKLDEEVCPIAQRNLALSITDDSRDIGSGSTFFRRQTMNCQTLAARISKIDPSMSPVDVARLCLLILMQSPSDATLMDDDAFETLWKQTVFRLEATADQHEAVSRELVAFGEDGPVQFSPDQLWMLMRAVKVQGQVLEMYAGTLAIV